MSGTVGVFNEGYEAFASSVRRFIMPGSDATASHDDEAWMTARSIISCFDRDLLAPGVDLRVISEKMGSIRAMPSRRSVIWALVRSGTFRGDVGVLRAFCPGTGPTIRAIISRAAEISGSSFDKVCSKSRDLNISGARMRSQWIARNAFDAPLSQIAEIMGKNHTTVLSGIGRMDIMIRRSPGIILGIFDEADRIDREFMFSRAHLISGMSPSSGMTSGEMSER